MLLCLVILYGFVEISMIHHTVNRVYFQPFDSNFVQTKTISIRKEKKKSSKQPIKYETRDSKTDNFQTRKNIISFSHRNKQLKKTEIRNLGMGNISSKQYISSITNILMKTFPLHLRC